MNIRDRDTTCECGSVRLQPSYDTQDNSLFTHTLIGCVVLFAMLVFVSFHQSSRALSRFTIMTYVVVPGPHE